MSLQKVDLVLGKISKPQIKFSVRAAGVDKPHILLHHLKTIEFHTCWDPAPSGHTKSIFRNHSTIPIKEILLNFFCASNQPSSSPISKFTKAIISQVTFVDFVLSWILSPTKIPDDKISGQLSNLTLRTR